MTEPITPRQFHHSSGVGEWRVATCRQGPSRARPTGKV